LNDFDIAFIGAGNMASSIVGGLLASGHPGERLRAADPNSGCLNALQAMGVERTGQDNAVVAQGAAVIVLAVKPQVMAEACAGLRALVERERPLLISIAAGISAASLQHWLGGDAAIVRCMPNTPALLRCGASGLYAADTVGSEQRDRAAAIMAAVGTTCWVRTEAELDAVTAVSGSGPAYFFQFMEAMVEQGVALGLERATATQLGVQTCLGAARMAAESGVELAELRRRVCSPGGTTERAVASLQQDAIEAVIGRAMRAAHTRSQEMARELAATPAQTRVATDQAATGDPASS
jgi:pyrroline-5-carboxylate reductase